MWAARRRTLAPMAEPSLLFSPRSYYDDVRTPVRRLGVSAHADRGIVTLSLWQGGHCTGTFQLPIEDAPRLIAELADALGAAIPPSPPLAAVPATESGPRRLIARLRERFMSSR